jgi:hypothetical protein
MTSVAPAARVRRGIAAFSGKGIDMKKFIALLVLSVALVACENKPAEEPAKADEATEQPAEETEPAEGEESAETEEAAEKGGSEEAQPAEGTVEVAADGTKFEPPIKAEQLPEGAWYCDMGTVHYARMEKGDGKCEVCGMKLKQN